MPFPNQKVLLTNFPIPRKGTVIRVCENDPSFWWVNVEEFGPKRIRGKRLRPVGVEVKDGRMESGE